jgi:hypothetical protein
LLGLGTAMVYPTLLAAASATWCIRPGGPHLLGSIGCGGILDMWQAPFLSDSLLIQSEHRLQCGLSQF